MTSKKIVNWFTGLNLILVLAVTNLIAANLPKFKIDLTRDKIYTLSTGSKQIINSLPDRVRIDAYVSGNLPAQFRPVSEDLKTILDEISNQNRQKLTVRYFDPSKSDEAKLEAQKLGIQPLQFNVMNNDKFEISEGYLGVTVNYTDKKEVIPVVGNVENLEYALLGTINSLVNPKKGGIAISSADNFDSQGRGFNLVNTLLEEVFPAVETVSLDGEQKPQDSNLAWMVILAQGNIGQSAVEIIDGWQNKGKPLMLLVDQTAVDSNGLGTANNWGPMTEWLKAKGVVIETKLAADLQSNAASVRTDSGNLLTQYPYWPIASRRQMNREIPAVSGLDNLGFFWASPIEAGGEFSSLIKTSPQAWKVEMEGNLTPNSIKPPTESELKEFDLAVIKTKEPRMVVFGDADWLRDSFISNNRNGVTALFNLLDYLTADEKMIQIRTKKLSFQPLPNWDKEEKNLFRAVNVAIPVIMLGLMAGASLIIRKKVNG